MAVTRRLRQAVVGRGLVAVVDRAMDAQHPVAASYVAAVRRRHPGHDPAQVIEVLTRQFLLVTTSAGAAVGGLAALPAIGTVAALSATAGEAVAFIEASALYSLAVAEVCGVHLHDRGRRRALLMAILAGEGGAAVMSKVSGGAGVPWARMLPDVVPARAVEAADKALTRWALSRYGTRTGLAVAGRLVPFGVGAVVGGTLNAALARGVATQVGIAFGEPPAEFVDAPPVIEPV